MTFGYFIFVEQFSSNFSYYPSFSEAVQVERVVEVPAVEPEVPKKQKEPEKKEKKKGGFFSRGNR